MTSVEIPVSIAAALPNLTVLDITNEVRREIASAGGSSSEPSSENVPPPGVPPSTRRSATFRPSRASEKRSIEAR